MESMHLAFLLSTAGNFTFKQDAYDTMEHKIKCWMGSSKEWMSPLMPEIKMASCKKYWKSLSAQSSLMSPNNPITA